jgi:hypothetical protein
LDLSHIERIKRVHWINCSCEGYDIYLWENYIKACDKKADDYYNFDEKERYDLV